MPRTILVKLRDKQITDFLFLLRSPVIVVNELREVPLEIFQVIAVILLWVDCECTPEIPNIAQCQFLYMTFSP